MIENQDKIHTDSGKGLIYGKKFDIFENLVGEIFFSPFTKVFIRETSGPYYRLSTSVLYFFMRT